MIGSEIGTGKNELENVTFSIRKWALKGSEVFQLIFRIFCSPLSPTVVGIYDLKKLWTFLIGEIHLSSEVYQGAHQRLRLHLHNRAGSAGGQRGRSLPLYFENFTYFPRNQTQKMYKLDHFMSFAPPPSIFTSPP